MIGRALLRAFVRSSARNSPSAFLARPESARSRKTVVCIGDSLTRGEVSCSYIKMLEEHHGNEFFFINAGINGELAVNVLARIDEILQCRPDYVTLLIGTNDANSTLKGKQRDLNLRLMKVAESPNITRYEESLRAIVGRLRSETSAEIALLSPPPIGEDFGHVAMGVTELYGCIVEETATAFGTRYLPVFEEMVRYLKQHSRGTAAGYESINRIFFRSLIEEKLFGLSYDRIADRRNFLLHTDILHLNCTGAGIIAGMIEEFLKV